MAVKTNKNNLFISKDEFVANRRKEQAYEARLAAESEKIKKELDIDEVEIEDEGVLQTVETVKKSKGRKSKE